MVPLFTRVFAPAEFAVFTEMYAYVSFLLILMSYGMETAYFRFSEAEIDKDKVYSTVLISLLGTSTIFILILILLSPAISNIIGYPKHPEYIVWFAWIIGLDAVSAIPFARLRQENKAEKFALLRMINIVVNIGLNLFFIVYCPFILKSGKGDVLAFVKTVYNPKIGIGYIFISNLISSAVTLVMLIPSMVSIQFNFDKKLWKQMLIYALPLLVVGLSGMVNENLDKIILKYLLPQKTAMRDLGIYGACYKISILMTIFIQAFRFAAEPFFFAHSKNEDSKKIYADVMKFFVIVGATIFLVVMLYIDVVINFVGKDFRSGVGIVPILLLANFCLGIFYNLSIWYKLTGKTIYGAYLSLIGAVITLILNFTLIPIIGYMGAAWGTLICYFTMMVLSYYIGQKYFPINYARKKIIFYILLSLILAFISSLLSIDNPTISTLSNTGLLILFLGIVFLIERPKKIRS